MSLPVNRYAAPCASCGARVPARAGALLEGPGRSWRVFHLTCAADDVGATGPRVVETRFSSGAIVTRNARGLCIDSPCCGCCSG